MGKIRWSLLGSVLGLRKQKALERYRLVVGLGNPGGEYAETRHNVGFWCVDRLAQKSSITLSRRRRQALIGEGMIADVPVALAKPRTFVNNAGRAVSYLLARYRASPADLLVIYDDMNLDLGKLRLRRSGSAGGHNGMGSIIEAVGSTEFARLRIGIGRFPEGVDQVEYVLGIMSRAEREKADEVVERATQAVICVLSDGMTAAMNRFN